MVDLLRHLEVDIGSASVPRQYSWLLTINRGVIQLLIGILITVNYYYTESLVRHG